MAEPLKYRYNEAYLSALREALDQSYPAMDGDRFLKEIFDEAWPGRELKARMRHIAETLRKFLPQNYRVALEILKSVAPGFGGFEGMFLPDFVERYGLEDLEASLPALEHFTKFSSSEFAVRPFIQRYPHRMMAQMVGWAQNPNAHVRRLASEGCRPRLPWAMALTKFKRDPQPIVPILEILRNDESESVRRSVANNLNDIAKDHPDQVIEIARRWMGESETTDKLVKHACRTLLKQGRPEVLELFGFAAPTHVRVDDFELPPSAVMGRYLEFSFRLRSVNGPLGRLRVEYALSFLRKNGTHSKKVFAVSESDIESPEKRINKRHSFKPISTRTYYPGSHRLALIVNGRELAEKRFLLELAV